MKRNLRAALGRRFTALARRFAGPLPPAPDLSLRVCRSLDEYREFCAQDHELAHYIQPLERRLAAAAEETFSLPGWCDVCASYTEFKVDYTSGGTYGEQERLPNWRERLVCCGCHLNNRMRAALHFVTGREPLERTASIYITERVTPLYAAFAARFPALTGSEYLRDGTPSGRTNADGVRHEDIAALSFEDAAFDAICTFDVLEHVPDYRRGLKELARTLKPGGLLLMSVPFFPGRATTLTRAVVEPGGGVRHIEEPEYHGDPLDGRGVLCFYHFGWDFLDAMREAGLDDASLNFYWSLKHGYLGGRQFLISARRATQGTPAARQ